MNKEKLERLFLKSILYADIVENVTNGMATIKNIVDEIERDCPSNEHHQKRGGEMAD